MADNIDVDKAIEEAEKLVASLKSFKESGDTAQHLAILSQSDKVRKVLESPYDTCTRLFEHLTVSGALYVLIMTGALQKLPVGTGISAADLAAQVNVDESIITRAMRCIIWAGIAAETEESDVYTHNSLSQAFLPPNIGSFFMVCMDFIRTWAKLPEYVKAHEIGELYDQKKSPFAFMQGKEGLTYYEVLALNPEERHFWNVAMVQIEKSMPILGMFPFDSLKEQVAKEPDRPFIVDVAGGRGQDLLAIQKEFGPIGKLILQDLPIVINSLKPEDIPGIEGMEYDFYTPQPIKNAHVYLMRRVMHDYYTPVCIKILKSVVPAMGPDSRLIICDMLLPDRVEVGGPMEPYWLDFSLLCISGIEKTLKEFNEIFDAVGLELVKVWPSKINRVAMLETRRKMT
ncbi:putative o-methyltransferase-like protein [Phaeomoniella chlamydospora]|uniref:Putative o-methyltransferase-like protein n=1 Tax=Phaeomoniella chlamydospora TaxID=158046 RepID=A0A0G2GT05_PHACM|nr:putative o-methyltransferase-like protein [Phaeomoniella chlamydospora]